MRKDFLLDLGSDHAGLGANVDAINAVGLDVGSLSSAALGRYFKVWLHIHVSQIKCLTDHLTGRLTRLEICLKLRSFC